MPVALKQLVTLAIVIHFSPHSGVKMSENLSLFKVHVGLCLQYRRTSKERIIALSSGCNLCVVLPRGTSNTFPTVYHFLLWKHLNSRNQPFVEYLLAYVFFCSHVDHRSTWQINQRQYRRHPLSSIL